MRKIMIATFTAGALAAGLGAATAAEPGEEQYFAQRGNFDASAQQNANPGLYGYNSTQAFGDRFMSDRYGPLGYVPIVGPAVGGVFFDD